MLKLITDRTSSDISRAKKLIEKAKKIESLTESELDEYYNGLKGCYNISDLNRVEKAVQHVSDVLNKYGYVNVVKTKEWLQGDFFTVDKEMPRYLNNLKIIKNAIQNTPNTPLVPNSFKPYTKANDIEKIIYELLKVISYLEQVFVYSGVSDCGQERLWQKRFRRLLTWSSQDYTFEQYNENDKIVTISGHSTENSPVNYTSNLKLVDINTSDKVLTSINSLNESMYKIDSLIGYEVEYHTIRNIIPDSSFENNQWNDTNNNSAYSTTEKAFGNRSLYFAVGTTIVANIVIERPILGHKYYGRRYIKTNGDNQPADSRFEVYGGDGEGLNWVYAWNRGNYPEWGFDSAVYSIDVINYPEDTRTIIRCFNVNTTADTFVDGLMLIDLTEAFGEGNEPTKEWCDENIPYFEGSIEIKKRKEV